MMFVPLHDASDESRYGGKAVSLGAAIRAGLPVPPGVALSADAVNQLASGEPALRDMLLGYPAVPRTRLAVRSSAVGEDAADASFAGQHETKLNVTHETLLEAVRVVWRSARTESALAYRARRGLALEPRMGVVVQMMVEPVAAGVLFTRNPITGADERLIEASWGLGEAVVNGAIVPDRIRLDPDSRILEMTAGEKDIKVWYGDGEGTVEVPVPPSLQRELCLTPSQVEALYELSERCRTVWGGDLDLEWALAPDGKVYLLQARPITTLPPSPGLRRPGPPQPA